MDIDNSIDIIEVVVDEIALEGLDGITLEALWQRIAIRIEEPLPMKHGFMEQIWLVCIEILDLSFYELENPRKNLVIFDRYELEYLNTDTDKDFEQKDIYEHYPIDDTNLKIRGSCSTYFTRKDISDTVRTLTLDEAINKYNQKLVIVASQFLRERALIPSNITPNIRLPIAHYCLLERIGRARKIGEITIKRNINVKEDAKTLFYIRKGLQRYGLIRKQVYFQGNTGGIYNGQNTGTLVHLTRFFNTRKPKVIVWAEHLINYLKTKENYAAEYSEIKSELNFDYSTKKFFKIQMLQKVFKSDIKVPYRSYYPNSSEKEWQVKNNASKERVLRLITLIDPNINISDLWRSEEVKDDDDHLHMDISKQKLNVPFLKQIYDAVEAKEHVGASQTELATEQGYTKLIARTLTRNLLKVKIVTSYLEDVGRQRLTKFVSRKFDAKSSVKKQIEFEISKIKKYNQSMQTERSEESLDNETLNEENSRQITNINNEKSNEIESQKDKKYRRQLFMMTNKIFHKYKLFKGKNRYFCNSLTNNNLPPKTVTNNKSISTHEVTRKINVNNEKPVFNNNASIVDSDFYKSVETKLIVQKPECKKKSQKIAVVGFMENVQNSKDSKQYSISYRLLRRANIVIENVKQFKIIEDTQKLMKFINKEEGKEGIDVKIDKNSLIRLLQKLAEDNFIKYIKLVMKNKKLSKQKVVNFICDPSIDINNDALQLAVEQAKLKFCMMEANLQRFNERTEKNVMLYTSTDNTSIKREAVTKLPRNNRQGKKYGYSPKFIRMKTMHIFLYYLIYEHPGKSVPKTDYVDHLQKEGYSFDEILERNINVYNTEINWKMFVPPLPKHRGYPIGWALMSDVLMRMPLSIFIKIHNVNVEVPGMMELLSDPLKRHMLVKDLPMSMRNVLFARRKYMFSIHEIVMRLCYLGLVQFGPQILKEKDQVFIFLNRHSELLDTTSSAAGYHKVEDKPYPDTKYHFTSLPVVENYWYEMWNTCINTCLGGRSVVEGKDILLEDLSRKPEMIQALKPTTPDEAESRDTGFVPGDRKGAAGIDSAFFPHLKRNWNWVSTTHKGLSNTENEPPRSVDLPTKMKTNLPSGSAKKTNQLKKRSSPLKSNSTKLSPSNKPKESSKIPIKLKRVKGQIVTELPTAPCGKPPKIIRKVLPRKPMRKRVKYDEIDFSALQRMDKLRVDWEQHEDNILLVCKVANLYLCPNPRRNLVTFTAIRDILRSYSFTSYNKTSRACQRRLLYMLKQPKTVNSVLLGVEEVKQDYFVNKRFGAMVDSVRGDDENPIDYEKKVEKTFKDLVTYIAKKYYNISNMEQRDPVALPLTIQEFNLFHKLKLPTRTIKSPGISKEVREVNDIHTATINSVIHSSMCCGKERRSWAYQLFKVYQQYPEYLLRSAMLKIRADQMVTMKKNYMCAHKKFGNCMPMSSSQYQLSSAYYYKFQTKWPYEIFSESYNTLYTLLQNYAEQMQNTVDGIEVKPGDAGIVAAIHDFVSTNSIDIDIEIPDQIIMLDPGLPEKDEVYQRIALRYQDILKGLSSDYAEQFKNSSRNEKQLKDTEQNNVITTESIDEIKDQLNFVEIRSRKRPAEHNYCIPDAKTRKLNDDEDQVKYTEENDIEMEHIDKEIESIMKSVAVNNDSALDIDKEKDSTLFEKEKLITEFIPQDVVIEDQNYAIQFENHQNSSNPAAQVQCESLVSQHEACRIIDVCKILNNQDTENIEAPKVTSTRVSELMKRATTRDDIQDVQIRTDIHDVRTRQTRIAMLKMREELHDLTFHDNHHAHEYFVVNSFKLYYSLQSKLQDISKFVPYRGMKFPKDLLPIDLDTANKVLEDAKKFAVFPKNPLPYDDFKERIVDEGIFEWTDINNLCKYIKDKAEFGATLHDLVTNFNHLDNKLADILSLLSENRLVLRAGIVTVRYIHFRYVNPWIIHSYKILRLEREAHQALPEGSVYILDNDDNIDDKEKETNKVTTATNLFYNSAVKPHLDMRNTIDKDLKGKDVNEKISSSVEHSLIENQDENTTEGSVKSKETEAENTQTRLRRSRTVLLKQKDIYRAAKLLDFNTAEEIKVVIKPWIRIDGVLNRRVLDRMLGAVLCYCIERPGMTLTTVQNRFTPAIQPYHTRELIEILVKLGCAKMTVQSVSKINLFSKPAKVVLKGNPDLVADSDSIIIEPTTQATLKFGMFLSNRSYSLDFLSSL